MARASHVSPFAGPAGRLLVLFITVTSASFSLSQSTTTKPAVYDVLVYGSTPSGVLAAVAAAHHGARTVALLSQREHIGGERWSLSISFQSESSV